MCRGRGIGKVGVGGTLWRHCHFALHAKGGKLRQKGVLDPKMASYASWCFCQLGLSHSTQGGGMIISQLEKFWVNRRNRVSNDFLKSPYLFILDSISNAFQGPKHSPSSGFGLVYWRPFNFVHLNE